MFGDVRRCADDLWVVHEVPERRLIDGEGRMLGAEIGARAGIEDERTVRRHGRHDADIERALAGSVVLAGNDHWIRLATTSHRDRRCTGGHPGLLAVSIERRLE